jgi:hypothetical protein
VLNAGTRDAASASDMYRLAQAYDLRYAYTLDDLGRFYVAYRRLCWDWRDRAAVYTASAAQVREKIHSHSVGKWRRFASLLRTLQERLEAAGSPVD